jgi:alpha-L-arabinofuranosidase
MTNLTDKVDVAKIEEAIRGLSENVHAENIKPFIAILEAIKKEPENKSHLDQLYDAFQNLGITQGAVLAYAPSIYDLIVYDPFGEKQPGSEDN